MFEELKRNIKVGSKIRISKGSINLTLPIRKISFSKDEDCLEMSIEVVGDNIISIFSDEDIKRVDRPAQVMGSFKFCFRVIEEDTIFYITD